MEKVRIIFKDAQSNNDIVEGETLEQQVERLVSNNEPTEGQAPLIYTERKEGIRAETNIRTDRWEIAIEAMDKVSASYQARRAEHIRDKEEQEAEISAEPSPYTEHTGPKA